MSTVAVKEKPILMSAPMVRAILDGRKTVTRRVVKTENIATIVGRNESGELDNAVPRPMPDWQQESLLESCPYGQPGDRLWVRETWRLGSPYEDTKLSHFNDPEAMLFDHVHYMVDDYDAELVGQYRPSIFMPRWASRLTLEIVSVRVERLQVISPAEIEREGFERRKHMRASVARDYLADDFRDLWQKLNGKKHPWNNNPWVWRIAFRRV